MKTKKPKLSKRAKTIARETVAEELRTRKYPRRQAVAIGLSRAREQARHEHAMPHDRVFHVA